MAYAMTEEDAIATITETLTGDRSIPLQLAMKQGIDEAGVRRLEEAVQFLIPLFRQRDRVPKAVAAAFLDLTPDFERAMDLYPETVQRRIEDLKLHVIDLAHDLLEPQ